MQAVRKATVEVLVLGVLGAGLALTFNAVRGSSGLELTKNYFDKGSERAAQQRAAYEAKQAALAIGAAAERVATDPVTTDSAPTDHPDHEFQEVSFAEAVEIFKDPNTRLGVNVFVDARSGDDYEAGHIPGAILADHSRLEDYIDVVLDFAEGADKMIVYCNGGNCEDSVFLCAELLDFEIQWENIFLFADGWKAWTDGNMPVETGMGGE